MMKTKIYILVLSIFIFYGCKKNNEDQADIKTTPFNIRIPTGFSIPVIPAENPMTVEGVALGRMLYYDPILSSNGLTCSSCHIADKSFSTPLFMSASGSMISVPPHINLSWNPDYNWNGSEPKLDHLCLADFGPQFFNTNMNELVSNIKKHSFYPQMFKNAFGISNVEDLNHDELKQKIVYAITQFIRSMVSADSKFDKFLIHERLLTQSELSGYLIFMTEKGDCFHCHGVPLFTSNDFRNNGIECNPIGDSRGRFLITENIHDLGKFSVPTLRNIELTAPYMHDGRFQTLEEVVEFYNSGVCTSSPNLDPIMTKPAKIYGLQLFPQEKADLVNFLKTLTDSVFISNPDYRKP